MLSLPQTPHIIVGPCSFVPLAYFAWMYLFLSGLERMFPSLLLFEILLVCPSLSSQASSSMKPSQIFQSKWIPSFRVFPWHLVPFMMCAVSRCLDFPLDLKLLAQYLTNRWYLKKLFTKHYNTHLLNWWSSLIESQCVPGVDIPSWLIAGTLFFRNLTASS